MAGISRISWPEVGEVGDEEERFKVVGGDTLECFNLEKEREWKKTVSTAHMRAHIASRQPFQRKCCVRGQWVWALLIL